MHTEVHSESGRVVVISDIADNESQAFTVAIKNPANWQEMHDYIINENDIDGIPNRRIDCTAEMPFSTKRAVYQISVQEAEVLRQHPKVEWVEESSTYNPTCLEQRKIDEEFDRHADKFRFKNTSIRHLRAAGTPGPPIYQPERSRCAIDMRLILQESWRWSVAKETEWHELHELLFAAVFD